MGYHLDFCFPSIGTFDCHFIVEMFLEAGATLLEEGEKSVLLEHADSFVPLDIDVLYTEPPPLDGEDEKRNWAHVRLSSALDHQELEHTVRAVLALANRVGARVYDGQIGEYVTEATSAKVIETYERGAHTVASIFGTCGNREHPDVIDRRDAIMAVPQNAAIDSNDPMLLRTIDELNLSVRASSGLRKSNVRTIGDLVRKTRVELLAIPDFTERTVNEIESVLARKGLRLGLEFTENGEEHKGNAPR